jgi:hypothetical protein
MHPKQVPIVIALSMLIVICAIATIAATYAGLWWSAAGSMVALVSASVLLGVYLPAPFSRSLTDVYNAIESQTHAIAALEERQDAAVFDPGSVKQQYTNIVARLTKIEQLYREPSTELIAAMDNHQEVVKRVAKILLQRTDDQSALQPAETASTASIPVSPQTSMSE